MGEQPLPAGLRVWACVFPLAVAVALPSILSAGEVRSCGLPLAVVAAVALHTELPDESGGEMALSVEMPLSLLHMPAGRLCVCPCDSGVWVGEMRWC